MRQQGSRHPRRAVVPIALAVAAVMALTSADATAKRKRATAQQQQKQKKHLKQHLAAPTPTPTPTPTAPKAPDEPIVPTAPVDPATPPPPEDHLSVYILTMGPGDHPFFKFGHNAIWIQDRDARTDRVYNFGTFRFDSAKLLPEFIRGRMTYWLSVSSIQQTMGVYERENRTVDVQELDLDAPAKLAMQQRLEENARPENRAYKYDYFLDNCSTRVRDAIDAVTAGRLRQSAQGPARLTLRAQALRLTADYIPEYLGLYLVLGPSTDRAVDRWAEMFIPQELARGLRVVSVPVAGGPGTRPLVKAQQTLFRARRMPPPEQPPERAVTLLLVGVGVALFFFAFGWLASRQTLARFLFGAVIAVWGLVIGFIGCFLLLVWAGTDHQVAYRNQNILQCAPFAIALFVLGWGVSFGMYGATRKALSIVAAAAALSIAGALLRVSMISPQDNGPVIAFLVPAWVGIAAGLYNIRRIQTLR